MIVQMLLCFHCIDAQLALDRRIRKYFRSIAIIQNIISNVLNDGCGLFIVDERRCLDDEFFRIILELVKNWLLDTMQDCDHIFSGQLCFFHQLADQIIFHAAVYRNSCFRTVRSRSLFHKGSPSFQLFF